MARPVTAIVRAGDKFGRLTVVEAGSGAHTTVRCRCTCGTETTPEIRSLRTGKSASCGCTHSSRGNYYATAAIAVRRAATAERLSASAARARSARELRGAGRTWLQIAGELGLPSAQAAHSLAQRHLDG